MIWLTVCGEAYHDGGDDGRSMRQMMVLHLQEGSREMNGVNQLISPFCSAQHPCLGIGVAHI